MAKGIVKWFDGKKGYGFIECPDGEDVFVHHTAIEESGHRTLSTGDVVRFEIVQGENGPQAANVQKL